MLSIRWLAADKNVLRDEFAGRAIDDVQCVTENAEGVHSEGDGVDSDVVLIDARGFGVEHLIFLCVYGDKAAIDWCRQDRRRCGFRSTAMWSRPELWSVQSSSAGR